MTTKTKTRIGCGAAVIIALLLLGFIAALGWRIAGSIQPATVETKWKPRQHEAATITPEDLGLLVRKEMDDAFKRGQELERLKHARLPDNPFEGDEEKLTRLRKYGFALIDEDGNEWGRVHRLDDDEITKGLFPSTIVIETETKAKPVVTYSSDHWEVTFETPKEGN